LFTRFVSSFATGLAIPASDVDIVVCGVHEMMQWWGGRVVSAVSILADALRDVEWVSTVQAIEKTAVPLVKV
jgi:DNA polymerase sigma